jgi:hypothetical protein
MKVRGDVVIVLWAATILCDVGVGCRRRPPPTEGHLTPESAALPADPPAVESASLGRLDVDAGTAQLVVRYAADAHLTSPLVLHLEDGRALLFDDGEHGDGRAADGVFAGTIPVDLAALAAREKQLALLAEAHGDLTTAVFAGRLLVGEKPLIRLDLSALRAGKMVALSGGAVTAAEVVAGNSLTITHTAVVGDSTRTFNGCNPPGQSAGVGLGKWTFGYLMQQAAGTQNPSTFARNWLAHWESAQTVNGFTAKRRSKIKSAIIDPWEKASGGPGKPLDLAKAPFRLLAIVNRIDLADSLVYGPGNGGELRFVFGAVAQPPAPRKGQPAPPCTPLRFTVIFEYDIRRAGCLALRQWAQQWLNLGTLTLPSAGFNVALEALTDPIVQAGAAPSKPNGSALNQLRTNEIALPDLAQGTAEDATFWDMREFRIDSTGALKQTTVKQTPDLSRNKTKVLVDYVNANAAQIVLDKHTVPLQFPTPTPFLGANALMQPATGGAQGTFWTSPAKTPIASPEARFHFSLNTCNGCHAGETGTNSMHISPLASPAVLSGFLTGTAVPDPDLAHKTFGPGTPTPTPHAFNDLQRRQQELARIANLPCFLHIFRKTLKMVD